MKYILIFFTFLATGYADIEIKQNIKALYKGVSLSFDQENYILDNQDKTIRIYEEAAKKIIGDKKIHDSNVIEYIYQKDGQISGISTISSSGSRSVDNLSKKIVMSTYKMLPVPRTNTPIRLIFKYDTGKNHTMVVSKSENRNKSKNTSSRYTTIPRGTSYFPYSSKEYVREFETSKDGFINLNTDPLMCVKSTTLLTENGQRVPGYYMYWKFNVEAPKGKYKLLIQTKQDCRINILYP